MIDIQIMNTLWERTQLIKNDRLMLRCVRAYRPIFNQIHFPCSVRADGLAVLGDQSVGNLENVVFLFFVYPKDLSVME